MRISLISKLFIVDPMSEAPYCAFNAGSRAGGNSVILGYSLGTRDVDELLDPDLIEPEDIGA